MELEKWLPVVGYEGLYEVSSLGNVQSLNFHREKRIMRLKGEITKAGYIRFTLMNNSTAKRFSAHRIVAVCFIPNPENKPYVNHLNGIKTDNRLVNLEWCTAKENSDHAYKTKLQIPRSGKQHHGIKSVVQKCLKTGIILKTFISTSEAGKELNIDRIAIANNCRGVSRTSHGFKFEYLESQIYIDNQINSHKEYL